jgi:hypothetical protein
MVKHDKQDFSKKNEKDIIYNDPIAKNPNSTKIPLQPIIHNRKI